MSPDTCMLCACVPGVGVCWAIALIGDTKQAKSEEKSGPVETKQALSFTLQLRDSRRKSSSV